MPNSLRSACSVPQPFPQKHFLKIATVRLRHAKISPMSRSELIGAIARRYPQLSSEDIETAVRTTIDSMAQSLTRRSRVEIRGFGSFFINRRPPRTGRNPRTGEKVDVPETYVPVFKVAKDLKERVDR